MYYIYLYQRAVIDDNTIPYNVELEELAAVKLLELSPGSSGSYVLMSNLYTSLGKLIQCA